MPARSRRSLTLAWVALFVLSLLLQYASFAAAPPVLAVHDEDFELDRNAVTNGGDDWDHHPGADAFGAFTEGPDETIFTTGGSKDISGISEWRWTDGSVPDKDDILNSHAALYGDIVYFQADRFANNGDANIGFWFFQDNVGLLPDGTFSGQHLDGDLFIVSEFTGGGQTSTIQLYEWQGDDATGSLALLGSGQDCTNAPVDDQACAVANTGDETAPWPFVPKSGTPGIFPVASFFEGGLDLNQLFGDGNVPCFSNFLVETRSSSELTAQLKDFIAGDFNTCAPPDIETQVSAATIDVGGSVTDTATLSGDDGPASGTVDFFVCGPTEAPADCDNGTQVGDSVEVDTSANGGTATSDPFSPTDPGFYCFRAEYTPDGESQYLEGSHTNDTTECFELLAANVTVVKTANPAGPVNAGDEIGFDITVSNEGEGTATDVELTDALPTGVEWSNDTPTGDTDGVDCAITGAVGSQTLTCTDDSMAAGDSFTVHVFGDTDAEDCGTIDNTAVVTSGNDGGGESSASVDVLCAEIDIEKTADPVGPVIAGDDIGFDIVVTNNGDGSAFDVHVSDSLPAGFDWSADAPTGDTSGVTCDVTGAAGSQELTCDDDEMEAGDSFTVHVSASTDADDCGLVENTATVTTGNDGEDSSSASVTVLCPDVAVEKTADVTPISAGETAAFTITVTSVGEDTAEDVVLDDTLPAGVDWVVTAVTLNGGAIANPCDPIAGGALHCDLGDLAAGDEVVIHIGGETDFEDCGTLHNEVTVGAADEVPGGDENNSAEADIVVECPVLGIIKSADHTESVVAGDEIGFTVTIANTGEGTAFDVAVSDTLPAGFEWVIESQSGGWSIVGDELTFGPADLAGGTEATVHITSGTDAEDCGLVPNTAVLSQGEAVVDDDSASETVRCPELGIEKSNDAPVETIDVGDGTTIDLPTAEEGATVTYTLDYTLVDGPVDNGIVSDVVPEGVTYVGGTASNNAEFTFVSYDDATRTLTWTAPTVSASGSLTYDVTVDVGAADLVQPLINVVTIESDQTPPDDDESPVFVPPVPQELTPPPTDTLVPSATPSNPGFALMLILLAIAGLALTIGFTTPVPESVRRRDRLG